MFSFEGRIRRREYGITILLFAVFRLFQDLTLREMPILHSLLFIPLLWFLLAQGAKRCHDIGKSGWWQIVPFFGLWMLFKDGDVGFNEYGEDPKGRIIIKKVPKKILDSEVVVENNEEASDKNLDIINTEGESKKILDSEVEVENNEEVSNKNLDIINTEEEASKRYDREIFLLGKNYYQGSNGVEKSYGKAVELWDILAKRGNPLSQYNVALCYYNGKGVEKDIDKAKEYLEKACERGFAPACELLKKIS